MIPGRRYAFQVFHPGSPVLRIRYRDGVLIGPYGFPEWLAYAQAVVELPARSPELGVDEQRLLDVLTANLALAASGAAGWSGPDDYRTPASWTWAHAAMSRQVALVPIELHGAFRHLGGVSTSRPHRPHRGVSGADGAPPTLGYAEQLAEEALTKLETHLGHPLPGAYRSFLAHTNGGWPTFPAIHPRYGFLVDQPFFGLARTDRCQDLSYATVAFRDRLTPDWLAVGFVQGGLLAVKVQGGDEGSVWYWDDDDHRDRDEYTANEVCEKLLHRCADDFADFWGALRPVPKRLLTLAAAAVAEHQVTIVAPEGMGTSLPAARRRQR